MNLALEWLRLVLGKKWVWVLPMVALAVFTFTQYKSEMSYHKWAGSYVAHEYSDVIYKDGYIRIKWEKLPKSPKTDIIIHYLHYRPGLPLIGTAQQFIPVDESNVYRDGKGHNNENLHLVSYWGSPVFVGELEPGKYEVVVYYEYPDNWWYPDWSANQRVVFTVRIRRNYNECSHI